MKKILGLSGGRRMGNSEVLLREALMGAEERGADIEIIRLHEFLVTPPIGENWAQKKDHAHFLSEKIKEADGIILSCPVYVFTPPGYVMNIRDRISGRLRPPEQFKIGAMISVGATDWVNLALPLLYLLFPHGEVTLVDQMLVTYEHGLAQVVLNDKAIRKARKLGINVAEALNKPSEEVKYLGDEPWICPICRQNLLRVRGKFVEYPICDIKGVPEITEDGLKVSFSEDALKEYRFSDEGHKRHIHGMQKGNDICMKKSDKIIKRVKKYERHITATPPPPL